MGTWDASVFGNDMAADWADVMAASGTVETVEELLAKVASHPETKQLDAGTACEALAAAEVVAAAAGKPMATNPYNEGVLAWASKHPDLSSLSSVAVTAAQRVRSPKSHLLDLWNEDGVDPEDREEWHSSINALVTRLQ